MSGPPIDTSLTDDEASTLRRLAYKCEVLEIGSAYGYSTVVMGAVARAVMSVDHHRDMNSLEALKKNLKEYGLDDRVLIANAPSADILPALPDGSFDGVFVDGDHSREGVLFDATQALRLVRPGGWLAFHDWDEDTCPDVRPALEEFFQGRVSEGTLIDTLFVIHKPDITRGRP